MVLGLFSWISPCVSMAQGGDSDLYIFGAVKDYDSRRKLEGCTVTVYKSGSKIESYTTNKNGKFEFFLPLDAAYKIEFTKGTYVSKHLRVDVKNIPEEDRRAGFSMGPMDVSLFKHVEGLDFSMLEDPIGKAKYYPERGAVEWDDGYTSNMLNKISKMMSDYEKKKKNESREDDKAAKELAKKQAEFDKLVADGDDGMRNKDFQKGVTKFQAALNIFSDNAEVKGKLEDAQKKLDEKNKLANQDKEYNAFVDKGDENFQAKNYEEAINQYQGALGVKAGEKYPTDQIKKAEDQIAKIRELKEKEGQINSLMADGDKAIAEENFDEGIDKYKEILKIDSGHKEAEDKLNAAYASKKEFESQAKMREEYAAAITVADASFDAEDYEKAISQYNAAAGINPKEEYPVQRAKESQEKLDEKLDAEAKAKRMEEIQAQFDQLVSDADELVSNENYDEAIAKYDEALNLVEEKNQGVVDKKQAAIDARDKQKADAKAGEEYDAVIQQADEAMKSKDYQEAITIYKEAIQIKDEPYPHERITEAEADIQELLDSEAAALAEEERRKEEEAQELERQKLFDKYMEEGELASQNEDFSKAIDSYNNALGVKEDKLAQSKLDTAESDLENQRKQMEEDERKRLEEEERQAKLDAEAELEQRFNDLVQEGDDQLADKSYLTAIDKYKEALEIKKDKETSKKIKEAEKAMAADEEARLEAERLAEEERLRQEALDAEQAKLDEEARLEAERLAEEARKRKELADAEQASKDAMEAERNKYLNFVKDGDTAFAEKDYQKSLRSFENASEMRPDEKYPISRIEKLEALIAQQEEDERRAQERADRRAERNKKAGFERGSDLASSEEDQIDQQINQARKDREQARWDAMEAYKQSLKNNEKKYVNKDNEQLAINQDEMRAIQEESAKKKEEADARHNDLSQNMASYKKQLQAQKSDNEEEHQRTVEENREKLSKQKNFSKDYKESNAYAEMTENNAQRVREAKEFQRKLAEDGAKKTEATHKEIQNQKTKYYNIKEDLKAQEAENIKNSTAASDQLKKNIGEFNAKGIDVQIENAKEMADQMSIYQSQEIARKNKAQDAREDSFDELNDLETYRGAKDPMSYGKNELAAKYPQGVTEEKTEEGKNIILRRIVVVGNKATEYKKVTSVSGTFYFKNGMSTSKYVWDLESKRVLD